MKIFKNPRVIAFLFFSFQSLGVCDDAKFEKWLLTRDYGILETEDLRKASRWNDSPPILTSYSSVVFWQCYPSNEIKLECGVSSVALNSAIPRITFFHPGHTIQFETKNVHSVGYCSEIFPKWKRVIESSKNICAAGQYLSDDPPEKSSKKSSWSLFALKSKKGEWHYYENWDKE